MVLMIILADFACHVHFFHSDYHIRFMNGTERLFAVMTYSRSDALISISDSHKAAIYDEFKSYIHCCLQHVP